MLRKNAHEFCSINMRSVLAINGAYLYDCNPQMPSSADGIDEDKKLRKGFFMMEIYSAVCDVVFSFIRALGNHGTRAEGMFGEKIRQICPIILVYVRSTV